MTDDGKVDYSEYSYRELLEALNNIDSGNYPQNYRNLQIALEKIGPEQRAALDPEPVEAGLPLDDPPTGDYESDPDVRHVKHLLTALVVVGISAHLLWIGDIVLPLNSPLTISLSGLGVPLGKASFFLAATVPVSFLVDLLDSRENQKTYQLYVLFADSAATLLLVFAYVVSIQS